MQVCREWHKPRIEMCVAGRKAGRAEPSKHFDSRGADTGCSLLGSGFAFIRYIFIIVPTFLPFGIRIYIMHNCILEVCNLLFYFIGKYRQENTLSLKRDFTLRLLNGAKPVKD